MMIRMSTDSIHITLREPNVEKDAAFAHSWFTRPEGRQTLLSMGNAEHEIHRSTLEGEKETLREFVELEKKGQQITRIIVENNMPIGVVWIELFVNHNIKAPSVHIMIGNPEYRGKGLGGIVLEWAIRYVQSSLKMKIVYTRHLVNNLVIAKLCEALGFVKDGKEYADVNNLRWQNLRLDEVSSRLVH